MVESFRSLDPLPRASSLLYPSERFRGASRRLAASMVAVRRNGVRLADHFKSGAFSSFRDRIAESTLFRLGIEAATAWMRDLGVEPIPLDRYVLYDPDGNDNHGFHSEFATGFRYLDLVGHAVRVSAPELSVTLCMADALRCYIHDSLHNATFRSFRLGANGEVFREQYGVNFRRENGVSYSAPAANESGHINLNLLMDGVVTLKTAEAFAAGILMQFLAEGSAADRAMAADILCHVAELPAGHPSLPFHDLVVTPTLRFLEEHQLSETGVDLIFAAMKSGRTRELVKRIEAARSRTWRDLFLSSSYSTRRVAANQRQRWRAT